MAEENKVPEVRVDGWANLLTGMGLKGHDSKTHTSYRYDEILDDVELSAMWRTEGFATKIVNRPVYDALRAGFTVESGEDEDEGVLTYLDGLKWQQQLGDALRWDRLYGGALLVIGAEDGGTLDQPLNPKAIRKIRFLRAVAAPNYVRSMYIDQDPASERYGMPLQYSVTPRQAGVVGASYMVHWTRCYEFRGLEVPPYLGSTNPDGRGDSVLQACYQALRGLGSMYSSTESILKDFVTGIMTIKGLQGMIASGRESQILTRMHLIDMCRSILNTTLLDEGETFDKKTTSVAGLEGLIDRAVQRVSAVSNIPMRILLGVQGGGLNNEGEGESRDYYDGIASYQTNTVQPSLEWLVELVYRQ